jgi:hypothetical protein
VSDLAILCVTRAQDYSFPFIEDMLELAEDTGAQLIIAADGEPAARKLEGLDPVVVQSRGYIESVLDEAISYCDRDFVLRLDDDERVSYGMYAWILAQHYREADHWAFARAHLWPSTDEYVTSAPLWPDLQTRLSVKAKAGARTDVHVGSPYGTGRIAPCVIEHHKFLVRSLLERQALVETYNRIRSGAGSDFIAFSLPEVCDLETAPYAAAVEAA